MKKDISQISTYESGIIQSTAHRLTMKVKAEYLAGYDLTSMQWFAIGLTYDAGETGIRLTELRISLHVTMPFITNLVNGLEAKGIIHKVSDLSDSRVKIALLNPSFRSKVQEIETGLREQLRNELYANDNITRQELQTYISVLYKIVHK